jgi:hypothetical protein
LQDYAAGKSLELASIARKFLDACTLRSTIANEEGDSHLFVEFPVVFRGHSLGDGPFGAVNKGRWKEMDVAVKTFRPEVIDVSPQWFHWFCGILTFLDLSVGR